MEIYKSDYWNILYDKENKIITTIFNRLSQKMTDDIYRDEMLNYAQLVEKFRPKFLLVDSHNFEYVISTQMQHWTNEVVFPRVKAAGLQKVAITVPPNIYTQLSLEKTMTEPQAEYFITQYFSNRGDAVNWLIS